jgi:hypothetical protein
MQVLDIDAWAAELATSEAAEMREAVRAIVLAGGGLAGALDEVRRRLRRLTPAQRETVVSAIGLSAQQPG